MIWKTGNWSIFLNAHVDMPAAAHADPTFLGARRLGRAFALEARDRRPLEEECLRLIADPHQDDYNRLAMHYLFLNYVSFLPEGDAKMKQLQGLEEADRTMPAYLSDRVRGEKKAVNDHSDPGLF